MKIITICRGNVGRSQVLAALLEKMFPQHTIISAGTKVVSPTTGESRHGTSLIETKGAENVLKIFEEEGIEWKGRVRTQLSPEMLDDIDLAVVMSEPEHIPEYLAKHPKMIYWEIADLKGTTIEFHREIKNKLQKLVEENKELFS